MLDAIDERTLQKRGWQWGIVAPILLALLLLWNSIYSQPTASGGALWVILLMGGWIFALIGSINWLRVVLPRWKGFRRKPILQVLLNCLPALGILYYLYVTLR